MATSLPRSSNLPSQRQLDFYEEPTFSLTPTAQRDLARLIEKHPLKNFEDALNRAQTGLTESAGDINDRLTRRDRQVKKIQNGSINLGDDVLLSSERSLQDIREKVQSMTQNMDKNLRKLIDHQHNMQSLIASIQDAAEDARLNANTQASTQNVRTRSSRRSGAASSGDDDEDDDSNDEPATFDPTDPAGANKARPPAQVFRSRLDKAATRYQSYSLAVRYGEDNSYRDFKRLVHDALYPDDDVPLPHQSEWFQEGNAPLPGVALTGTMADDDEDDDIAVSKATISTKCPITLREFKDPVTSKKCPHSFESSAIISMIRASNTRVPVSAPAGQRANTQKAVQCPALGCSQMLSTSDLHTDPILLRKIKRVQAAKQMQEDEDDEDTDAGAGSQRRAQVIDDDEDEDGADIDDILLAPEPSTQPKREPRSTGVMRDDDEDVVMMSD